MEASQRCNGRQCDGVRLLAARAEGTNNSPGGRLGPSAGQGGGPGCCVCRDGPATAATSVCSPSPITTRPRPPVCVFSLRCSFCTPSCAVLRLAIGLVLPSPPATRCVTGSAQRKFTHAPVGRALLPLPASTAILARWTCKAKLAGPRSKHTTYPLIPTQHSLVHLPSPSLHFPSCARSSWTSNPSTQFPRSRVPRVRLSRSPVTSPSLQSSVERVRPASSRELRPWLARPASCMRCTPVDSLVLSACISPDALCCKLRRTLLTHPKQ